MDSSKDDTDAELTCQNPTIFTAENNGIDIDTKDMHKSPNSSSVDKNGVNIDGEHDRQSQSGSSVDKNGLNAVDGNDFQSPSFFSMVTRGLNIDGVNESQSPEVQSGHTSESGNSVNDDAEIYVAPKLGVEFESEEHAYKCYNRYAAIEGFSIRKDFVNKSRVNGLVVSRRYTCYKQGHHPNKRDENVKKPRKGTRTGCLAHMTIARQPNGRFKVAHFEMKHNHEFATPFTTHLLPSQKRITFAEAVKAEIADHSMIKGLPKLGMGFDSEDHVYCFYNEYAARVGFSVRKDYVNRSKIDGAVASRRFTCFREGFRQKDRRDSNVKRPRKETRIGCLAQLIISRQPDGKYRITHFEENHNHELVPACRVRLLRSQKRPTAVKSGETDEVNCMRENFVYHPIDYRNKLPSKRTREMKQGEAESILEYFQSKQLKDPSFFYSVQLDAEDEMTNVFWADAKMPVDYGDFGDVVRFDTTSRLNKEFRPFALFVGVNHHRQVLVFGAALLYDETIESFKWLFRMFIEAMSMKKPKTILTDQDAVMTEAVILEFPETLHRVCSWNIYQNSLGQLSKEIASLGSLASDLCSCIFHHDEEEDFINAWKIMLGTYGLWENEWLNELFKEREKWALPYGRHIFCADIQSAQLCESFNINLSKCLKSELNVLQFLKHFGKVVNDWRYKELEANYDMSQNMPRLMGDVIVLKQARDVYTPKLFELFQQEYENCLNIVINQCTESASTIEFKVSIYGHQQKEYTVMYNSLEDSVVCNCMKFQFVGILCSHALKVLDYRNIKVVPSRYILKRWTREARL